MKILDNLSKSKILILGFGREGQSTLAFLRKYFPKKVIGVADQNSTSITSRNMVRHFGVNYLKVIEDYEVVFKSPGIPNKLVEIKNAKRAGKVFTSQTKLFFDLCRGMIVGITGTKGKSTTATLVFQILKTAGKKVVLLGNIGKPCLDYLDDSFGKGKIFVFEMSSHQLSDLTVSPHISVFLNIYKEHLDYYESFNDYVRAKENITKYQSNSDVLIFNEDQALLAKIAKNTKARAIGFGHKEIKRIEKIVPMSQVPLLGKHNLNNIMASVLVARVLGVKNKVIQRAIATFKPLEHRLQKIGNFRGITFYEDSLATIPEATIAAIDAMPGQVGSLVAGGSDRHQSFRALAKHILTKGIEILILFPVTGDRILKEIRRLQGKQPRAFRVKSMLEAVKLAYRYTKPGTICLLSTASPSFSLFKDYEDKAKQFIKAVKRLSKNVWRESDLRN